MYMLILPPDAAGRADELFARRIAAVAVQRQLRRAVLPEHMCADSLINYVQHRVKSYRRENSKQTLPENRHAIPSCTQPMLRECAVCAGDCG